VLPSGPRRDARAGAGVRRVTRMWRRCGRRTGRPERRPRPAGYRRGVETVEVAGGAGRLVDTGPVGDEGGSLALAALVGEASADVCVVGLGGTGLSAVRTARARGLSVVGLDAAGVASGAAGRNGGFLLAGLAAFHHDAAADLGAERATALYRLTLEELAAM